MSEEEGGVAEDATTSVSMDADATDATSGVPAADAPDPGRARDPWPLDLVIDVPLRVTVEVGRASMLVRDVLQLTRGSVIPLDRRSGDPADILVNGRLIARGELSVVDDKLAVRVVEVIAKDSREETH